MKGPFRGCKEAMLDKNGTLESPALNHLEVASVCAYMRACLCACVLVCVCSAGLNIEHKDT